MVDLGYLHLLLQLYSSILLHMFIVNSKTVFITAQFKEIEERLPSPTEQAADPAKKADSYKMAGAQVTQEQEKHLKMVSSDEVLMVYMPPTFYNVIYFCEHLYVY